MDKLADYWERFTKYNDRGAREELIIHYASWVKYLVARLSVWFPISVEMDDLISFGIVGLIEAVDHFDPAMGVKFETYATPRIRGQIIDSLRALDLIPRSARLVAKEIELTIGHLSQILGRIPDDAEVANYLGLSLHQYHKRLLIANCAILSLDESLSYQNGEDITLYDSLEDPSTVSPAEKLDNDDLRTLLISAVAGLSEREQLILSLYYNDGLTMKEISRVLELSESRVSQIHSHIILALRGKLDKIIEASSLVYNRRQASVPIYASAR